MNPTTTTSTYSPADITAALNQLTASIPTPTIPALQYTAPTASDLSSQYLQFLNEAATDPTIVNYYSQVLQNAQGDYNTAIGYLQSVYTNIASNISTNLTAALQTLGLTFTGEQENLQNSLNQRGIALTQNPNGSLSYGTTGESGYEVGQLTQSQQLRQEAENRSASQQVTSAGLTYSQGATAAGQGLAQQALTNQGNMGQAVANEAGTMQTIYNQNQTNLQNQALQKQQNATLGANSPYVGNNKLQSQLPSALFNASGNTSYNGVNYNVGVNSNGTRNISLA